MGPGHLEASDNPFFRVADDHSVSKRRQAFISKLNFEI